MTSPQTWPNMNKIIDKAFHQEKYNSINFSILN